MAERPTAGALSFGEQVWTLPEPTKEYYTDELMTKAKEFSDTAVVVIGRSGGEGADLPTDMGAVIDGTYNIAEKVSANPSKYGYFAAKYENNGTENVSAKTASNFQWRAATRYIFDTQDSENPFAGGKRRLFSGRFR